MCHPTTEEKPFHTSDLAIVANLVCEKRGHPAARLDIRAGVPSDGIVTDIERDPAAEADGGQRLAGGGDRAGQERAGLGDELI